MSGPRVTARRLGRELALQILYQVELTGHDLEEVVREFPLWQEARPPIQAFARELAKGVLTHREELDGALGRLSANWSLERMTVVDRNVLRLGAYEMRHSPDTPVRVVINEAIELAKKFGTAQSGRFVNGVLDALRKEGDPSTSLRATQDESGSPSASLRTGEGETEVP